MIPVKFDPRTFARLADMAEAQGVTIGRLIEDAAQRLITGVHDSEVLGGEAPGRVDRPGNPAAQEGLDGGADRR